MRRKIEIRIALDTRVFQLAVVLLPILCLSGQLASETITLSTTYPSPVGIYARLITTGGNDPANPAHTVLARDNGNVGIGTPDTPTEKLEVNGNVKVLGTLRIANLPSDPKGGSEGAMYFNTNSNAFMGFKGGSWSSLGGGPQMRTTGTAVKNPGNILDHASVSCANDEVVTGGGGACFPKQTARMAASEPTINGWSVWCNDDSSVDEVDVYAICAKK